MNLLSLETSTDACSVALYNGSDVLVDHRLAPVKHAQLLLPMVEQLLAKAGLTPRSLDGVAFGCGPGSFTGVRIAAATAQGIAFGAGIGVIPVSSLQALAQGAKRLHNAKHVLASFDARMGEVYWGAFSVDANNLMQAVIDESVCSPDAVPLPPTTNSAAWVAVGSGIDQYNDVFVARCETMSPIRVVPDCWPSAQDVHTVALPLALNGQFRNAEEAVPVYLRNRVALTEAERADGQRL